jgi:uncharacterized membrane protein
MGDSSGRIDAFTDSAFAFAVSLLVIGGTEAPKNFGQLERALYDIPAFAFGFGVIAVFWLGHVRWRSLRGSGTAVSLALTLLLVFSVLIYVQPLRSMAAVTSIAFSAQGAGFKGSLPSLFAVYGSGFALMAAVMAGLFHEVLGNEPAGPKRARAAGERGIWSILAATGALSFAISFTRYGVWAAMIYMTLPLTIGLFARRHRWSGPIDPPVG